jgi:F-type H+-transporting ATPase subunit b
MAQPTTAATAHEGTHEGAHEAAFPPFQGNTFASQLIWIAITFGLLYMLMSRVALPRVAAIIDKRDSMIENDLAQAQQLKSDSEAAAEAYEKELAEARAKAQAIAQETRDALASEADSKRKALEADLATKLAAAEETIRTRTNEAMASVKSIAADTAAVIVERLIGRAPDRAVLEAALDKTATG